MEEKRKGVRVQASVIVSFKVKASRLTVGSRIKDISEIGICLPSKQRFPAGTLLELEFRIQDLKEPIKTLARVVRVVDRNDGNFPFEVGVEFMDMPYPKRSALRDFIKRIIAEGGGQGVSWSQ